MNREIQQETQPMSPRDTEMAFLEEIGENGMTFREALSFEDREMFWLGPVTNTIDLLDMYLGLGIIRFDNNDKKFKPVQQQLDPSTSNSPTY
jgi:hypothetical protein